MAQSTLTPETFTQAEATPLQQIYLGVLVIQPSPFCNINCDYCYLPNRTATVKMEQSTLKKVMERVWESGLVGPEFQILWHAGEPLAVPIKWYREAFETIAQFPEPGQRVVHSFQTNATLINQDWCDFIIEHRIEVGVSLDGPAHIHDHHRKTRKGEGTHAKAMQGIELLKKNEIPFGLVAVISDISLDHPDEIFHYFADLGIEGVGFNIEEVEGANAASSLDKKPEDRVRRFLERVYELNHDAGSPLRIREFEIAQENIVDKYQNLGPDGVYYNLETNPLTMVNVDCYGNFSTFSPELLGQATDDYGSFNFGNVAKDTLFDATQNPAFQKVYADVLAGNEKCKESCPYWTFCGGASPSNKYYENGTFDSAETSHCRCMIQMPMDIVLADLERQLELD